MLKPTDESGRLKIVCYCRVGVVPQGVEVSGGAVFEVTKNLKRGVDLIIARAARWALSLRSSARCIGRRASGGRA